MEDQSERASFRAPKGRIELSGGWPQIQAALGLSLTELTKLGRSAIIVKPYFGRPKQIAGAADLFVLMPFDPQLRPIYEDHIAKCAHELHLNIARGDDLFTAHSVMDDIWNAIHGSRIVIADCTGRNPNVFYEIGLAHAIGNPVILITQTIDDVPFDIRHLRYILYDYTPRGMRIFEKRLTDTLRAELGIEQGRAAGMMPALFIVADGSDGSLKRLHQHSYAIQEALGSHKIDSRRLSFYYRPVLDEAIRENVFEPLIVHIIGHPGGLDAVMTTTEMGAHAYEPSALGDLLRPVANIVRCVILSACFSEEQAAALAREVPYVIGIHSDIDDGATSFAVDFYRSLNAGRSIVEAYEIANNSVRLEGVPEDRLPKLIGRNRT